MVHAFSLLYTTADALSSSNNTGTLILFFLKTFKQKKAACNSREFMWHLFPMQFHLPKISVTSSVLPQSSKLVSDKTVQ